MSESVRFPEVDGEDSYHMRVLMALDRALNATFGGSDLETISARLGRNVGDSSLAGALSELLDVIDPDHVIDAIHDERITEADKDMLRARFAAWKAKRPAPPDRGEDPQAS